VVPTNDSPFMEGIAPTTMLFLAETLAALSE
jgi:hypothetical protein